MMDDDDDLYARFIVFVLGGAYKILRATFFTIFFKLSPVFYSSRKIYTFSIILVNKGFNI